MDLTYLALGCAFESLLLVRISAVLKERNTAKKTLLANPDAPFANPNAVKRQAEADFSVSTLYGFLLLRLAVGLIGMSTITAFVIFDMPYLADIIEGVASVSERPYSTNPPYSNVRSDPLRLGVLYHVVPESSFQLP